MIAYFGNNIPDFPHMTQKNIYNVDNNKYAVFGRRYYIFKNPIYGSWEIVEGFVSGEIIF